MVIDSDCSVIAQPEQMTRQKGAWLVRGSIGFVFLDVVLILLTESRTHGKGCCTETGGADVSGLPTAVV